MQIKISNCFRMFLAFSLAALLTACASGSTVMLSGTPPEEKTPVEEIEIFLDDPDRPYKIIALVNTSADTDDFFSAAGAEKAALEKLKKQASEAGADGIIDIYREVLEDGAVVSSVYWGRAKGTVSGTGNFASGSARGIGSGFGSLFKSYSICFRAKAIKFEE